MSDNTVACGEQIELLNFKKLREDSAEPEAVQELQSGDESAAEDGATPTKSTALGKELTLINGVGYIAGGVIGSGIFITPKTILTHTNSFGLSLIVWIIGGLIAFAGALCYCELGTLLQKSGAEFVYIREAYSFKRKKPWFNFLGSLLAFLFVWASVFVIRASALAIITLACARYLCRPFYIDCDVPVHIVKLLALSALIVLAIMNSYSVKISALVMTVFSFLKLLACAFIVILGIAQLIITRCVPEDIHNPFQGTTHSPFDVALALYGVMWAYDGWNTLNYAVEETKNVEKNLPRAVMIGVPIVSVCYLLINISFFVVLSYDQIKSAEAVALIFGDVVIGKVGLVVIPLIVSLSTFGAANGTLFTGSRLVHSAARDGLLPDMLSGIHNTFKTPMPAIIFQVFVASVLVVVGNIESLIGSFGATTWLFYGLAIAGLIILRFTHKEQRPYKVFIGLPIFMVLVAAFLVVLPLFSEPIPSLSAFGVILLGTPVYIFFVMETPWKLRPKVFDKISAFMSRLTNSLLNTQSSR